MDRVPREVAIRLLVSTAIPALLAVAFGVVQAFRVGTSPEHWYDTVIIIGGGAGSLACLWAYSHLLGPGTPKPGWIPLLLGASRFGAFAFAIYLLAIAGAFRLFQLFDGGFTIWRMLAGMVWLVLGFLMLRRLLIAADLVEAVRGGWAMIVDDSGSVAIGGPDRRERPPGSPSP